LMIAAFIEASPLASFLQIGRLDLLKIVGTPLACTDWVAEEVISSCNPLEQSLIRKQVIEIPTVDTGVLSEVEKLYKQGLGRSEASSILSAKAHGCSLILDDRKARELALKHKRLHLYSTVEVIVCNIEAGVLSLKDADTFIDRWHVPKGIPTTVRSFRELL